MAVEISATTSYEVVASEDIAEESDQRDSDGDVDDCLFYEADIQENHSSEQEIIEESGSTTRADGDVRRSDSESSDDDKYTYCTVTALEV
ncbi:hypothetical protein HHI36_004289 [Cryptolaemus montrouzieri]|uniref:Uncharacterized protein n=1 Tax=Cryptolaemus montrouzieri TaxID=559131 RepID=A0ABD2NR01_9CUCU